MGSEIEIFDQPFEQVVYEASPVVESIAMLFCLVKKNNESLSPNIEKLQQTFGMHPVIEKLRLFPEQTMYLLYNFLLPIPSISSVEVFTEKLKQMKNDYFLYYLWSEDIPLETVQQLLGKPASIWTVEETYYWQKDVDRQLFEELLLTVDEFKQSLADVILSIATNEAFRLELASKETIIQQAMKTVEDLSLEPLQRAQYVMGKTFRRVSPYKLYYFIPSYFLSPFRMRIFDDTSCFILYGCAAPISDKREKSEVLSKQLKALADPTRLLLLSMIATNKEYGAKLAEYLGITTATVSHHIETLKKAGLVHEEKIGTIKYFTADKEQVNQMLRSLQQFLKA
jgi:DNA-binding transcriptional ArsR family regulator